MLTPFETARRDINRDAVVAAIAECFRADRDPVNEPLPERLAALLEQVEQAISDDNE
jgi:hemerythrin-like domain-containing protein